mgnify:CR=1 FL=1
MENGFKLFSGGALEKILEKFKISQTKENCNTTHKFYSNKDTKVLSRLLNNNCVEILNKEF